MSKPSDRDGAPRVPGPFGRRRVSHCVVGPDMLPLLVVAEAGKQRGETVEAFLSRTDWKFWLPTLCVINGEPVLRGDWSRRQIRARDEVQFLSLPGNSSGGGQSKLKQIGSIAAVVALMAAAIALPYLAPAIAGFLGTSALAVNIAGALLIAGGSLLLSYFLRPKSGAGAADGGERDSLYSINSAGNAARPLQAIPVGYGRRIQFPDLAAQPYSNFEGDTQTLYQLFCLGCGDYELEEIRIDDTPLWENGVFNPSFPNVEIEIARPGEEINLFPVNVVTAAEVDGQELPAGDVYVGGFIANPAETVASQLIVDIVWPSGAFTLTPNNSNYQNVFNTLIIEARQVDNSGDPVGGWTVLLNETYALSKPSQIRLSPVMAVAPGRYEVRVKRSPDPKTDPATGVDNMHWTALRAQIFGPQTFSNVTMLAMKMKADAALSSLTQRRIATVQTRKLPVWNGSGWSDEATRNPVWAALDIWSNPDYSAGLPQDNVDLAVFAAYAAFYDAEGHTFDHFFTAPVSVYEAIETALKVGRANPAFIGDRMTLVRDEPRGLPRMMFTDREIIKSSLTITHNLMDEEFADGVVIQYLDETSWQLMDVHSAPEGQFLSRPATVQMDGLTRREQAVGLARFLAACNARRRRTVSFQTELEGRLLKRGDCVLLQSELPQTWGQGGEVVGWNALARKLTLRPAPAWVSGQTHYLELRTRGGAPFAEAIVVTRGASDAEAVVGALEAGLVGETILREASDERPSFVFSPSQPQAFRMLVTSGQPSGRLMTITGVIDDEVVYDVEETGFPPIVPGVLPPINPLPIITGLTASIMQTAATAMLNAGWTPTTGASIYIARVSYDGGTSWLPVYRGTMPNFSVAVSPSSLLLQVAGETSTGYLGPWTQVSVQGIIVLISDLFVELQIQIENLSRQLKYELSLMSATGEGSLREFREKLQEAIDRIAAAAVTDLSNSFEQRDLIKLRLAESVVAIETETVLRVTGDSALASQITTVVASVGTVSAAVSTEATARASGDSANASAITGVQASLNGAIGVNNTQATAINGLTASVAITNGNVTANASAITTLSSTVGGHTATISQQATTINGYSAQWGVVVNFDGVVGGFVFSGIKQLGLAPVFSFKIFGDVFVDGTITGRKLAATELIVNSAQINNLVVGTINLQDGTITSIVTAGGNDVNNPVATNFYAVSTIGITGVAGKIVPIEIIGMVSGFGNGQGTQSCAINVNVNATIVHTSIFPNDGIPRAFVILYEFIASGGPQAFNITMSLAGAAAMNAKFVAKALKR